MNHNVSYRTTRGVVTGIFVVCLFTLTMPSFSTATTLTETSDVETTTIMSDADVKKSVEVMEMLKAASNKKYEQLLNALSKENTGPLYGIGVMLVPDVTEQIEVKVVFKNSPADHAGIIDGDRIVSINGVEKTWNDLTFPLFAEAGKNVTFTLKRNDIIVEVSTTTFLLHNDRREEAAVLRVQLESEGAAILNRLHVALDSDIAFTKTQKKMPRESLGRETDRAVADFSDWFFDFEEKVEALIAPNEFP